MGEKEEALIQSALQRISRARAKGKADVKLNKEELAALERRRQRMQEEEERRKRGSGSESSRGKKRAKEQRIAVPLTHLEPISRKRGAAPPNQSSPGQRPAPRHVSMGDLPDSQAPAQVYPPMGYFAPPSTSRSRQRSGTSSRAPSQAREERGSSPYQHDYPPLWPPTGRQVSDSATRARSSRGSPYEESLSGSRTQVDPFQYQTAGTCAPPAGPRRYVSGPAELVYDTRRGVFPAPGARHASRRQSLDDEPSEDDSETSGGSTSEDSGARVREPRGMTRDMDTVVEMSPERGPSRKKPSPPAKKKPASGGKRRKR